jgi:anti-sigma factor RsiW
VNDTSAGPEGAVSRETLMRFLDGELPPDERRRVEAALERSTELQRELAVYRMFHEDLTEMRLSPGPGTQPSVWTSVRRRLGRPLGWLLLSGGVAVWAVHVVWVYLTSPAPSWEKAATSAVVIGILILFASVIVERYQEWQTDPYKDVER